MMIYNGLIADSGKESGKGEQEERTKPIENKDGVETNSYIFSYCAHTLEKWNSLLLLWGRDDKMKVLFFYS